MLPTFLSIGPSRCASTWTHQVLKRHPQILMTTEKEASFFGKYCIGRSLADYRAAFRCPDRSTPPPVRGDVSPWYARLSRQSIEAVRHFLPEVRIVMTLRNPL